ncbi:MAG: xylene monooxygenase, partial [Candidatus Omnitrophica bacterium]|nr:xylene monooxygenase [Candidatus Omnitrophota bacterium]MBD3269487.1 xylene monooxygenase [Candidatus Omnitrophota bacterium]
DYIEFTKKVSESRFSQNLLSLSQGEVINLQAPLGNCILKEEYEKISFLIGGIGITPVISIIEYIFDNKLNIDTVLFYSNRTPQDIAFKDRLDEWSGNENIKVYHTITDCKTEECDYIRDRINESLLKDKVKDWPERIIFIFGPPSMVKAMERLCPGLGCKNKNIKTENFVGY